MRKLRPTLQWRDDDFIANSVISRRRPVEDITRFLDFDDRDAKGGLNLQPLEDFAEHLKAYATVSMQTSVRTREFVGLIEGVKRRLILPH